MTVSSYGRQPRAIFLFVLDPTAASFDLGFKHPAELSRFREEHKLTVSGSDVPEPIRSFADLLPLYQMAPILLRNIRASHYSTPTAVQMQASTVMLQGRDLIACAPTGSGKTLAFLLPVVHLLKVRMAEVSISDWLRLSDAKGRRHSSSCYRADTGVGATGMLRSPLLLLFEC